MTRKVSSDKWDSRLVSKKKGDLASGALRSKLLMKRLWKFASEEQTLWKEVILDKCERAGRWTTKWFDSSCGISLWKSIRNLWPMIREKSFIKIRNGRKTLFWEDNWIGQGPLNQDFPEIFVLSLQREAIVADLWSPQGWKLNFRRPVNDWEIENLVELLKVLEQFKDLSTVKIGYGEMVRVKVILPSHLIKRVTLPAFKLKSGHGS